jgi:hypothetical protein
LIAIFPGKVAIAVVNSKSILLEKNQTSCCHPRSYILIKSHSGRPFLLSKVANSGGSCGGIAQAKGGSKAYRFAKRGQVSVSKNIRLHGRPWMGTLVIFGNVVNHGKPNAITHLQNQHYYGWY